MTINRFIIIKEKNGRFWVAPNIGNKPDPDKNNTTFLSRDEIIEEIKGGTNFATYVKGNIAHVEIITPKKGEHYLRSVKDRTKEDNLAELED